MIQFFLMLFSLAFSHHNANATTCNNNNQNPVTVQNDGPSDPGGGTDPGDGTGDGGTGGNTGQTPPPFTPPNP